MNGRKKIVILAKVILFFVTWSVYAVLIPSVELKFITSATAVAAYAAERPFYAGKTINIIAPSAPGAGYDQYARLLTRHMGKHIPGTPRFVVENMIGGGCLVAANHLYNRVKPDGLTFMVFNHANIVKQLVGDPHVLLDVRKMKWIGTASDNPNICVVRNSARYNRIEDMIGAKEPLVFGATPADTREYVPKFLNEILGTNFKIITGYKSGSPIFVAIESGETDGVCGIGMETVFVERPNWLKDKYASIFLQVNPVEKMPALPNVPWVMDYVKNPADRQLIEAGLGTQAIAYSFAAPPGVPNDRVEILRKAFSAAMKDDELLAEMAKRRRTIKPRTGPEIEAFIKKWLSLPKESVDKIRKIYFPAGF